MKRSQRNSNLIRVNGAEALIDTLKKLGVDTSFGIVGSSLLEVFDLLPKAGIRYFGARHEQFAGHMADAYSRITGKPSLCILQNGAGLTNIVTASATAYYAHSPVIFLSGAPMSTTVGRNTYQEADHVAIMKPVTKMSERPLKPGRIVETVKRAYRYAITGVPGPVHIDILRDFLYEMVDYDMSKPELVSGVRVVEPDIINKIAKLIKNSKNPIILAGGGVVTSDSSDIVMQLSRNFGIPVCSTYMHNDVIDNDYDLMLGAVGRGGSKAAMNVMKRADLILALGTRLDEFTFIPYYDFKYDPEDAIWIQVNCDPDTLDRSRRVDYALMTDVKQFTSSLIAALERIGMEKNTAAEKTAINEKLQYKKELLERYRRTSGKLTAPEVYIALNEFLPRDFIAAVDIGATPAYAYSLLNYHAKKSLIATGPFAGVGFSIPAALGAKIASPKRSVYAFLGDGAFTMELPALITSKEYDIDINVVVFDNEAWGAEKSNQKYFYDGEYVGTNLKNPDLAKVVRSIGGNATVVDERSKLKDAIREAFGTTGLNVLIVKIDPEDLPAPARKDALKKAQRGLFLE
ncbi:MAG: thiamine pyrophosphate-binding protein [Conexivisphaerales archaeon]